MHARVRGCGQAIACLGVIAIVCVVPARIAAAHPLGNFTVNHYSRVEVTAQGVRVRYVLDMAEIPSVQEARSADTDGNGVVSPTEWEAYKQSKVAELSHQLELTVDSQQLVLEPTEVTLSQPLGQGDIPLVRLEAWFQATTSGLAPDVQHRGTLRDRSDPARIGWREIVIQAGPGVTLADSTAPSLDVSDELRSYPDDMLQNPLDRREARWSFTLGASSPRASPVATTAAAARVTDPFTSLVTAADLNPAVVLLALLGAAFLGGMHAASPGHGKSVMAAYIVGTRGSFSHALALALSVTVAHTTGVLVLGLATVLASNLIFPERLYPWLTLVSGALVLVVGLRFLLLTLRRRTTADFAHGHDHHHGQASHDHNRDHGDASHNHGSHDHGQGGRDHGDGSHDRGDASHDHGDASCGQGGHDPGDASHDHDHGSHDHGQGGRGRAPSAAGLAPTWRSLFALGLAGGVVPSGSALVVLLSSVALGRLGFGLVLIVAFGLGMAVVLVATGVLLVHAGRLMLRLFPDGDLSPRRQLVVAAVPIISASLMTLLGGVTTFEGLSQLRALSP